MAGVDPGMMLLMSGALGAAAAITGRNSPNTHGKERASIDGDGKLQRRRSDARSSLSSASGRRRSTAGCL